MYQYSLLSDMRLDLRRNFLDDDIKARTGFATRFFFFNALKSKLGSWDFHGRYYFVLYDSIVWEDDLFVDRMNGAASTLVFAYWDSASI